MQDIRHGVCIWQCISYTLNFMHRTLLVSYMAIHQHFTHKFPIGTTVKVINNWSLCNTVNWPSTSVLHGCWTQIDAYIVIDRCWVMLYFCIAGRRLYLKFPSTNQRQKTHLPLYSDLSSKWRAKYTRKINKGRRRRCRHRAMSLVTSDLTASENHAWSNQSSEPESVM